jgi:prepilin-type N-terminal cleavage/methylation domain-containing protein
VIANERGLTLIELMVAVFIITVGLVAVATGMQIATAGVTEGQQMSTATFLAEQRLEDIKSFALSTGSTQGWSNVNSTNFPATEAYGTITANTGTGNGGGTSYAAYRRTTTINNSTSTTKTVTVEVFFVPVSVSSTTNAERSVIVTTVVASRS